MKCKYKIRYFSSKGAYLVLLWTLLTAFVEFSLYSSLTDIQVTLPIVKQANWLISVPIAVALFSIPLTGWLADARFGNYRVFRAGTVILFISTVVNCLLLLLESQLPKENQVILIWINLCLKGTIFLAGICACTVAALPLGLDQMPDASSSSIASYIAWFVCSIFVGFLLGGCIQVTINNCFNDKMKQSFHQIWSLLSAVCMSVVLTTIFAYSPKWLIIEPKSPQIYKTIYEVLKFASKHKAPPNRSAFTYWEEDIPSRIDLGKIKYGGPFTTEQVENVKTILRLIAIISSLLFASFSFFFHVILSGKYFPDTTHCESQWFHYLTYNSSYYAFLGTLAYEFLVYPFFKNKLPSILKRIGAALLVITIVSFVCFILKLTHFLSHSSETTTRWIVLVCYHSATGFLAQVLLTSFFELMCAQSPYNMRGLLVSIIFPLILVSASLGSLVGHTLNRIATLHWILFSVKTVLCLTAFLLFCVVARWYKRRVRDDNYSTQQVVEEVYDRYLTAAAAHSTLYGTNS